MWPATSSPAMSRSTPAAARVQVDIGFGGAIYVQVRAADLGLVGRARACSSSSRIGREIKWLLDRTSMPSTDRQIDSSGVYGTMLYDELGEDAGGNLHQRNVTIFADGARGPIAVRVGNRSAHRRVRCSRPAWRNDSASDPRFHRRLSLRGRCCRARDARRHAGSDTPDHGYGVQDR